MTVRLTFTRRLHSRKTSGDTRTGRCADLETRRDTCPNRMRDKSFATSTRRDLTLDPSRQEAVEDRSGADRRRGPESHAGDHSALHRAGAPERPLPCSRSLTRDRMTSCPLSFA